jgi:hypothetical protein
MPGKRKGSPKESSPKTVLRLPDLDHAKRTVLDSLGSPDSARAYAFAMYSFIAWYCSSLDWLSASTSSCGNELSWSPSAVGYHMATDKVRYRNTCAGSGWAGRRGVGPIIPNWWRRRELRTSADGVWTAGAG